MIGHYVEIEPVDGQWVARCSSYDFTEKFSSRDEAFVASHLHIGLALAGKEDHD